MSIFKRLSDIVSANINDMLYKAENPQKMIKQIVREMEQGVLTAKRSAAEIMAAEKKLKKELERNKRLVSEWQSKAIQAVDLDHDDLAKKALTRKREIENILPCLEAQSTQTQEVCENMRRTLRALESRLSEARRRQITLVVHNPAAKAQQALSKGLVSDDGLEAFGKFDVTARKVEDEELKAEALAELNSVLDELENVDDMIDVEIELERLKKTRRDKTK